MTTPDRYHDTDGTHAHDFIWPEREHKPETSWWTTAPRENFTALCAKECAKLTTTHGRKRGPEYRSVLDRPIAE